LLRRFNYVTKSIDGDCDLVKPAIAADNMIVPVIDWDICQHCEPCDARLARRTRAIVKVDPDDPPYIEPNRCNGCAKCVTACLMAAITIDNHK